MGRLPAIIPSGIGAQAHNVSIEFAIQRLDIEMERQQPQQRNRDQAEQDLKVATMGTGAGHNPAFPPLQVQASHQHSPGRNGGRKVTDFSPEM